jgi:predicted nuclease of predicted toxin-antitoxin system
MKFICDVHIPIRLSKFLANQEAESIHVNQILAGSSTPDSAVNQYADTHDYIVITKDADFRNTHFLHNTLRKLIRVCLGNIPNDKLIQLFEIRLPLIRQLDTEGSFYTKIKPDTIFLLYQ